MTVKISWSANTDTDTSSYLVQRSISPGGPWLTITSVPHVIPGDNWDSENQVFFYNDPSGTSVSYYRLIAYDATGGHSTPTAPFRAGGAGLPAPPLVNSFSIVIGNVGALLELGYTAIEVWLSEDESGTWTEITGSTSRLELNENTAIYSYYHADGHTYSRYKWRFSKNGEAPFSPYSKWVPGKPQALLDPNSLSVGIARFVGLDGRPVKRTVVVAVQNPPTKLGLYATGDDTPYVVESDDTGYLQVPLMRGLSVKIAVEQTAEVRQLTVPDSPTFDIFDASADVPDRFTVQAPPPRLTRRSLP